MLVNIWICNPYDPLPGEGLGELRYGRLAQTLVAQGHSVTWWSADWSHTLKKPRFLQSEGRRAKDEGRMRLKLVPVSPYRKNISLKRIWSHRCYARGIVRQAEAHVAAHGKPDVILFSVPPMEAGAVALKLGRKYDAKVLLDVMDAWPKALLRLPMAAIADGKWRMAKVGLHCAGRIALWPYSRMMRRYCREADGVCAQSQAFVDYARSFGAQGEIPVFYLGAQRLAQLKPSPSAIPDDKTLHVVYLGSMGRVYDLSTLVDAVLQLLAAGHALRLDLIGTGEQRGGLEAKVAAAGQEDAITFHGYLQGAALESVLVQSDLGVVPMYPESAVAVPYKACDYLAAGMPVINSLPGELMEMLEATGSGQFYTAGDTASMDRALTVWLKDRDALAAAQVAARRLFAEQLDADKIDPAYAEWVAGFGHNGEG